MSKKGIVFENTDSKRRVTIQLRRYDLDGNYEEKTDDAPLSIQVKNASNEEVSTVILDALKNAFGKDNVNN